ncbi:Lamin-B receptor [Pseudolycoriella hygida]|uniref:Lamin-B receptor n=1 Tax=Pseudolycoriella hygida TaxID=35572 RepID=A0A9Q0N9M4_9DIPT|nr:Lamin-B receptor [Pseudolycoriella hygida]
MERRGSRGVTSRRVATKSPTRNKSPSRKSPSRKSPVRKSPVRKSPVRKSPVRKSPARKAEPSVKEEAAGKRGSRARAKNVASQPTKLSPKIELQKVSLSPIKHEKGSSSIQTKTTTTTTSSSVKVSQITGESDEEIKRFVANKLSAANEKLDSLRYTPTPSELSRVSQSRSMSRSVLDEDEYSDRETEPIHEEDRNKYNYRLEPKKPSVWTGLAVFASILLISAVGFYLTFSCKKNRCDFSFARLERLKSIEAYCNLQASIRYMGYFWAIFLLSALPIGRSVPLRNDRLNLSYNFNGIVVALIVGIGIAVAEYLKYPCVSFIYSNHQQFCFISILYALVVAFWRYVIITRNAPSYEWNPYAKSGSFWIDYFIGREINARWLHFDIKLIHHHAAVIGTLLWSGLFFYINIKNNSVPSDFGNSTVTETIAIAYNNIRYDPVALCTSSLVFLYALDLLIFEHHITSSFFLQGEGVGAFLLLREALFPFLISLIAKYTWEHKIAGMPNWALFAMIVVFAIGWFLKRASNKIKYEFRVDPSNRKFYDAETIATFQQRRLLVSSYWGFVRQPNHLGEIILHLSLLTPLIWSFAWPPFIAILIIIIHLILRGKQLSNRNFNRYNSHWTRYCQRVKYILIPKVF